MAFTQFALFLTIFVLVWVLVLSIVVYVMTRHYNKLTDDISKTGLREILDTYVGRQGESQKRIEKLEGEIEALQEDGKMHIQRIGIVRFNPFSDTGGTQSFTMALLDGKNNGVIMTSLYARSGNRWYVKEISAGKGKSLELSKEEERAIHQASIVNT